MTAYVIFIRETVVSEPEMDTYNALAMKAATGRPIRVLSAYGPHEVWEGEPCDGILIAAFPDGETAKNWYYGEGYQKAKAHRLKGAKFRVIFTEGDEVRL